MHFFQPFFFAKVALLHVMSYLVCVRAILHVQVMCACKSACKCHIYMGMSPLGHANGCFFWLQIEQISLNLGAPSLKIS